MQGGRALECRMIHYFMLPFPPLQHHIFPGKYLQFDSVFHNKTLKILNIFKLMPLGAAYATVHFGKSRGIHDSPIGQPAYETHMRDSYCWKPVHAHWYMFGMSINTKLTFNFDIFWIKLTSLGCRITWSWRIWILTVQFSTAIDQR